MPDRALVPLPIDEVMPEIVDRVQSKGVLVLEAPPGAGKTTRVPAALLDAGIAGKVVVLEPRRLAARLAARRVAEERGERVGETIGYEVRFERSVSASTRIEFVTEGILTRRLLADPDLPKVGAVVLDEFHERHLQGDLALALLDRLRRTSRPDLRLVVMSATLNAIPIATYLDAPVVTSAGRQYEVRVTHAAEADARPLEAQVASGIRELLKEGVRGDVLVFLPGAAEIRRAIEHAETLAKERDLFLVPLHGDLSPQAQDVALRPAGRQKVIFSTNVAETSVTIEGVEAVIDTGLARVARHDPWSGRPSLDVSKISRASAAQRAGRAGRLGPGRALRLFTKGDFDTRPGHDAPEILRADLAETMLFLRALAPGDAGDVRWLDAPPRPAVLGAEQLLARLGALDPRGALTETGRKMAKLALPPRLAKLLLDTSTRGATRSGALVAAMLAEGRDVYARSWEGVDARSRRDESSDVLARLADVEEATARGLDRRRASELGLDLGAVSSVMRAAEQYVRLCRSTGSGARDEEGIDVDEVLRRAVLAAFPDRVAKRRQEAEARLGASRDIVLSSGGTARLADSSVVRTSPWLVAVEAGDRGGSGGGPGGRDKRRTHVWMASAIEPDWLIDLFPGAVEEKIEVTWSSEDKRVVAVERLVYDRLVLDERPAGPAADEAAATLLAEKARAAGMAAFVGGDAFEKLARRIAFVVRAAPDLAKKVELAPLDDAALQSLLVTSLAGKRSFAEIREAALFDQVRATIGFAKLARLDELVPDDVTLGGGRRVKIHYEADAAPWIESRLQDFFGSSVTPTVLEGRVPLVLHLLAPNGRDVQVTTDLAGFWSRTYPSVRNELMRRYPRHAWPVDPLTAKPPEPRHKGRPT